MLGEYPLRSLFRKQSLLRLTFSLKTQNIASIKYIDSSLFLYHAHTHTHSLSLYLFLSLPLSHSHTHTFPLNGSLTVSLTHHIDTCLSQT